MKKENNDSTLFQSAIEKVLVLKAIDIFSETIPDSLLQVAAVTEELIVHENDLVFKEGDPSMYLYLIVSGKVRISRLEREIFVAVNNDSFGLVGLVEQRRRATTATAIEETRLLRIEHTDFFDLIEDNPSITKGVLRGISSIIRKLL